MPAKLEKCCGQRPTILKQEPETKGMFSLPVRLLNGEQVIVPFENPRVRVLDLFVEIWKGCGIRINHIVLEEKANNEDVKHTLVLGEVHNEMDFRNQEWFEKQMVGSSTKGAFRVLDLAQFDGCSVLSVPKPRKLVVYCRPVNGDDEKDGKDGTKGRMYRLVRTHTMCLDLNDLTFHRRCAEVEVEYEEGWGWAPSSSSALVNSNVVNIDMSSFFEFADAIGIPDLFRGGSRVFESTPDRIDQFIAQYVLRGYQPAWKCKVQRTHFSVKPLLEVLMES